jgi:hypothetical protein
MLLYSPEGQFANMPYHVTDSMRIMKKIFSEHSEDECTITSAAAISITVLEEMYPTVDVSIGVIIESASQYNADLGGASGSIGIGFYAECEEDEAMSLASRFNRTITARFSPIQHREIFVHPVDPISIRYAGSVTALVMEDGFDGIHIGYKKESSRSMQHFTTFSIQTLKETELKNTAMDRQAEARLRR